MMNKTNPKLQNMPKERVFASLYTLAFMNRMFVPESFTHYVE